VSSEAAVAWLRQRIRERMFLAQNTIRLGNAAEWQELSSGVLMTCRPDDPQDRLDGVHPLGDSTLTRLMEANDPQDTIARCEAELGILDLHALWAGEPSAHPAMGAAACAVSDAVRHVARGYRHWEGYAEHWGESA